MNTIITSKEAILEICCKLVSDKGLPSINIRTVAKKCNVSVGTIYYYFPSKEDLIMETIQSVWKHIFNMDRLLSKNLTFIECVSILFDSFNQGAKDYPNFFTMHSISFATDKKSKAVETMNNHISKIKLLLLQCLQNDSNINKAVFSDEFTLDEVIDFTLSHMMALFVQKKDNCNTLIEIIRRILY